MKMKRISAAALTAAALVLTEAKGNQGPKQ